MTLPKVQRSGRMYRSSGFLADVRYKKHRRSIARWLKNKLLPEADLVINGRRYWLDETLDAWDEAKPKRGHKEAAGVDARA